MCCEVDYTTILYADTMHFYALSCITQAFTVLQMENLFLNHTKLVNF